MRCTLVIAALVLLVGCQDDKPRQSELPAAVAETRAAILEADDYAALRPLIDRETFLSDAGEDDPVRHWERLGDKPLETMKVLLQMPHQVRETNEGTLYQWPRFGPDSTPEDLTLEEEESLRSVLAGDPILPEVGYTAPRLGILEDGTWWFFIVDRAP